MIAREDNKRRIAGKLCPMYSHSPLYSVTYYVGRVEGEASVPRVVPVDIHTDALAGHEVSRIVSCIVAKRADETAYW